MGGWVSGWAQMGLIFCLNAFLKSVPEQSNMKSKGEVQYLSSTIL